MTHQEQLDKLLEAHYQTRKALDTFLSAGQQTPTEPTAPVHTPPKNFQWPVNTTGDPDIIQQSIKFYWPPNQDNVFAHLEENGYLHVHDVSGLVVQIINKKSGASLTLDGDEYTK